MLTRFALALLFVSPLCSLVQGQIDLSFTTATALEGVKSPRIVGDRILIGTDSKPTSTTVAIVKAITDYKFLDIEAYKSLDEIVVLEKLDSENEWLVVGSGTITVTALAFDPEKGIAKKRIKIELSPTPPGPDPGPDPTPDVPPDVFDNIGQRIATWSAGLPKRLEVGQVYKKYSLELVSNPTMDINRAIGLASTERLALLGVDASKYNDITTKLNADVSARWPMSKGTLSDYLGCVAKGYGAK